MKVCCNSPSDLHLKCFLFDLDGTLFNSINDIANSCNVALEKYGLQKHSFEEYINFIGSGEKVLLERAIGKDKLNIEIYDKVKAEYNRIYNINYDNESRPYDGVIDMLKKLKEKNCIIGILSNKPDKFVKCVSKKTFNNIFDIVLGQREGHKVKPDTTSLCEILHEFKVGKKECVYIGDSYVDVATAKNAGILSIAVLYGYGKKEETLKYNPDCVCESVPDLVNLLLKIS